MPHSATPAVPMIDADYERDCPRCGGETEVNQSEGYRECSDESCPWDVFKGRIV